MCRESKRQISTTRFYLGGKFGIGRPSDSWIQEQKLPLRSKDTNRKPNCRQYFSMYSAHWPPNKPKAPANFVNFSSKAGKVLFVCIFGQSLPPRCSLITSRSSLCWSHIPTQEPVTLLHFLGWLLWVPSLYSKPSAFTTPVDCNTAPGGRVVSVGCQLSQREQESLPSFGTAP